MTVCSTKAIILISLPSLLCHSGHSHANWQRPALPLKTSLCGGDVLLKQYVCFFFQVMDHFALKVMDGDKVLKLLLPSIPSSLEQLMVAVKELCCCTEDISLKYLDSDFEDFFDLSSPTQIKHKDTIRVVRPTYITLNMQNISNDDLSFLDDSTSSAAPNSPDDAHSIASQDTVILSPSSSPERAPWPKHFPIPVFC